MKFLFPTILLFTLLLFSCGNAPKQFDTRILDELGISVSRTGKEITPTHLRYYNSKKLNDAEQKEMQSAFSNFLKLYKEVRPGYRNLHAVKNFLVCYLNSADQYDSTAFQFEFTGKSPLAVANALLYATGIDLNSINDSTMLKKGSTLLSISEDELFHGIFYLLTHTEYDVIHNHKKTLREMIWKDTTYSPDYFAQNILLPFSTSISAGMSVDDEYVGQVSKQFNRTFEAEGNPYSDMINELLKYMAGGSMHSKYQKAVNSYMRKKGYSISLDRNFCGVYRVVDGIDIDHSSLKRVQLLKECELSRRNSRLGDAMYKEAAVNIYQNSIEKEVSSVLTVMKGEIRDSLLLGRIGLWQIERVLSPDSMLKAIYQRDFSGSDSTVVRTALIREVAVHEAKHAWDAQFDTTDRKRRAFDSEVSAHLAEAVLSEAPHYSIMRCLHRFHSHLGYSELRSTILELNENLWTLVEKSINNEITEEELRKGVLSVYESYRDRDNFTLPLFETFQDAVGKDVVTM